MTERIISSSLHLLCACLIWAALPARANQDVRETRISEAAERHLPGDQKFMEWTYDPEALEGLAGDRVETFEVGTVEPNTVKLTDVVKPIHFESGVADIPASTVEALRTVLNDMRDRHNVRLNLVGHADNERLSPRLAAIYGDNFGLSRERAGQVAEYFQAALELPADAVSYEWMGDTKPVASNDSAAGRARNRRVDVEVWYDKLEDGTELEELVVVEQMERVKVCRIETVCKLRYVDGHERRARVLNLVAPLRYTSSSIDVRPEFTMQINRTLQNLADKQNVVVKFIGFTDNQPLAGRTERIYGNHDVLSKARARRVALAIQDELGLATASVNSDGRGATRPLASNDTIAGRALNRRVEVEFWYDDPLQDLPDEPQLCPDAPGAEMVTKVYDPPWGAIAALQLDGGQPIVPAGYADSLERAMADVADKSNARLRFVGYTRNERLDRRTATVYGDDIGLSAARARRTMDTLSGVLELGAEQAEFEGRGYLHSNDVVNAGFIQGDSSYVAVEVVYDELAVLDDNEGLDITPLVRELEPKNPFALNMMRITVDGEPIDDPNRSSADVQRCTDVALKGVDIRFGFDNLTSSPRLSVAASPTVTDVRENRRGLAVGDPVRFKMYANYNHFIEYAEIRIFDDAQSTRAKPRYVVEVGADALAEWKPNMELFTGPVRELKYVLRAYGEDGSFDETAAQPLWVVHDNEVAAEDARDAEQRDAEPNGAPADAEPLIDAADPLLAQQLLTGYGENSLAMHNIRLSSGTVRVQGSDVPEGHSVYVAGQPVPVDQQGNFVTEAILPTGAHTVEVALLDEKGRGESYLRDLEFEPSDWFYVGMADLTVSHNSTSGPMDLLVGDNAPYDYDSSADGRLAFYVNGKFGNKWRLTASADTREEPLENLFTNFMNKSPDSLFRRIDPDYHYPTFGDDSTVEEMAPTLGKFYVKLSQRKNHAMWGNFKVGYMDNELAQVDRGLYGANIHYETPATTSFGEQRFAVDAFGAEPGTIPSRQEFRGTGGSVYFMRHQDLMLGSERVRIEIRDRASGLVTGVVNLSPTLDYDIDYLQGSILLAEPLASTVNDDLLVRSGAIMGDEAYLVVRYEYTPGFDEIDSLSVGGQTHVWINDYIKVGLTANLNEEGDTDSSLNGADVTLRATADTWLKVQGSESEGLVSGNLRSVDGGFGFVGLDDAAFVDATARGYRADLSIGLEDALPFMRGKLTLYKQELDPGYSGPGLATSNGTEHHGGALSMPIGGRLSVNAKTDTRLQEQGVETEARELNLAYQLSRRWDVSTGVRQDLIVDHSPVVALTQSEGERTDAVLQVGYDSEGAWRAYGFVQDTVSQDGDRPDNGRFGVGGAFRVSEKMTIDTEISTGDLGAGGKLGSSYIHSERTSLYLNYTLENERFEPVMRTPRGSEGSLVSGVKTRLSDSTSVYLESRYRHGDTSTGLTHATGVNFSASQRWTLGANTDVGTLRDVQTGAETERLAGGIRLGYGSDKLQLSSGVEYRSDDTEQPDLAVNERETWLFRNSVKYQMTPASRLLGKLNHSQSDSSLGDFFAGGYTEAVVGYGFRPVRHDRLNALVKYTYFYNVPTTDQLTLKNSAAEFVQKSHVASVDLTYDLTQRWSIGGKYAYRLGEISLDREDPEFFDNSASLYVLRADYRFRENWELLMETRLLDMPDLDEQRQGALFAISRNMGDHFKVGAGYNFTDFSSDLTDLSFDHHGVFLNFTGAF
ncbi:MAG: OmpA family protein [Gammaproteobacteria bacterium]|nr:OmpA family protein [Gammaproteobacteria bacterium]